MRKGKAKEKEKARRGHLKGVIGRDTEVCFVRQGLVGEPANRSHRLAWRS